MNGEGTYVHEYGCTYILHTYVHTVHCNLHGTPIYLMDIVCFNNKACTYTTHVCIYCTYTYIHGYACTLYKDNSTYINMYTQTLGLYTFGHNPLCNVCIHTSGVDLLTWTYTDAGMPLAPNRSFPKSVGTQLEKPNHW